VLSNRVILNAKATQPGGTTQNAETNHTTDEASYDALHADDKPHPKMLKRPFLRSSSILPHNKNHRAMSRLNRTREAESEAAYFAAASTSNCPYWSIYTSSYLSSSTLRPGPQGYVWQQST
jgi:hypothetical protein